MRSPSRDRAVYTPEQLREMLTAWGIWDGVNNARAAMHLVGFTSVIEHPDAAHHLDIRDVYDRHQEKKIMVAFVKDWDGLIRLADHGDEHGLLVLARSLADPSRSAAILLSGVLGGFGHASARRVIEAIAIATGYAEWYTISPGPGLIAHQKFTSHLEGATKP